ncbi:MAG: AAA family ATPase [Acidithiobacillus sp.]
MPYLVISAGGASDSMVLKGASRVWSTAQPGAVIRLIQQTEVANQIIIIDEVDKCGSGSQNGNLIDTLLQLIEPSSAAM